MADKTVWHLLSNRWNSAITEYALSAACAFETAGAHSIFSPLIGSPAEKRARGRGLETVPVESFSLASIPRLNTFLKERAPHKVFLYGGPETFLARFLHRKGLIRFYGQEVNSTIYRIPHFFEMSTRHLETLLVPNQVIFNRLNSLAPRRAVTKITLGLEVPKFRNQERNNEIVIVGRLDPVKGHERAIQIFAKLLSLRGQDRVRPCLHVVGQAANLSVEAVKSCAKRYGLKWGEEIKLTETRVHNIAELMSKASVGMISSLGSEQICRVAQEFLLVGTPVFVSGAGATEEVLFDGAGGSYRGENDENAAGKLGNLFDVSYEESSIVRQERSRQASERFSLEVMGRQLVDLIS
ncbi:MAG: glycosyltransferase [Deltaproteobacteria bacterium]|nr:glycosyltransferase [Deltaproteobacteria bacterium]